MNLTILCVSKREDYADPFTKRLWALAGRIGAFFIEYDGSDADFIESVLDRAIDECPDGYILRIDDDEVVSPEMEQWLAEEKFLEAAHWAFPRAHLYPDADQYIMSAPLWPDYQTRLSVKSMAGGRTLIHQGSPHGTGRIAPVAIEHHKFLVRSLAEREALIDHYERLQGGAGREFRMFSVPEGFLMEIVPYERKS